MPVTRRNFITKVAQMGGYSAAFSTMDALGLLPRSEAKPFTGLPANLGKGKRVVILGAVPVDCADLRTSVGAVSMWMFPVSTSSPSLLDATTNGTLAPSSLEGVFSREPPALEPPEQPT